MDRTITVNGIGEDTSPPDRGHIDLRVGAGAPTVAEASSRMASASREVIAALRAGGAEAVSTARLSIRTDHDHQGRQAGFRSEVAVRAAVGLSDSSGEAVSKLVAAAVDAGGDHLTLDGIEFVHSDPTAAEHEAARKAIADARARAEVMVDAAGAALGEVVTIEQSVRAGPGPIRFRMAAEMAADIPVEPGDTSTTVEVRVTYALR